MTDVYDPAAIEPKWQEKWEAEGLYRAVVDWERPKLRPYQRAGIHWLTGSGQSSGVKSSNSSA